MSEAVEETGSLSEHEAQYGRTGTEPRVEIERPDEPRETATDHQSVDGAAAEDTGSAVRERSRGEDGRFAKEKPEKHRAKSQEASAEDVPRIRELTKRLREAEERANDFERRYNERPDTSQREIQQPAYRADVKKPEFAEPEPKLEDFVGKSQDDYGAYLRALARYDRRKEQWEADQERQATEAKSAQEAHEGRQREHFTAFAERLNTFKEKHPDYDELIEELGSWKPPPAAYQALLEHENGPQFVYNLMKEPSLLAGLDAYTREMPLNADTVAIATRWLEKRAQAASTGSAAPTARKPTPPPPNPVRTVPSGSGVSDDDSDSLSAHERKYGQRRR